MRGVLGLGLRIGMGAGRGNSLALDPDAQTFIDRVLADGGTVEDAAFLNSFVLDAKANNYFNDIVAAYSPSWGVKLIGDEAATVYSITGEPFDLETIDLGFLPSVATDAENGKSVLRFDTSGVLLRAFAHTQPSTCLMLGARQTAFLSGRRFYDGATSVNRAVFQSDAENIGANAGAAGVVLQARAWPVGELGIVRHLFDGASGEHSANESSNRAMNAGANVPDGLTLGGAGGGINPRGQYDLGAFVILDSVNDAAYPDKLVSLRDFSSSNYLTPWGGFGVKGSITYGMIGDSIASSTIVTASDEVAAITLDGTGGVGGNTLAQIDARTASYVSGVPQTKTWVIGGANDLIPAASDPNASMQASIQSICSKIVAGGSIPILSTMEPWGNQASWNATKQGYTDTYDAWIISYAATNGWDIVDMVATLSDDNLTLKAAFDSGDGLHPNSDGFYAIDDSLNLLIR